MAPEPASDGGGGRRLGAEQREALFEALRLRFEQNVTRHEGAQWTKVRAKLEARPDRLWSLAELERTGGEPDVVGEENETDEYVFFDCSKESPAGRRSLCYDREALEARKKHKPKNSAVQMAMEMGVELLTEEQYRTLQALGEFDTKTSSWLHTPSNIRELGGAIFGDFRFGTVSSTTTVRNHTTPAGDFGAHSGSRRASAGARVS